MEPPSKAASIATSANKRATNNNPLHYRSARNYR